MSRALLSLFALLLIVSVPGIHLATQDPFRRPVQITPLNQITPRIRTPTISISGLLDQMRLVVRDRETWSKLWTQLTSNCGPNPAPLPEIDFSRDMLIVAAMGKQPNSGYGIIIDSVYANERTHSYEVSVRSIDTTKCPRVGHADIFTSPVDIVRLPRADYSIVFRETKDLSCGPVYSPTTPSNP